MLYHVTKCVICGLLTERLIFPILDSISAPLLKREVSYFLFSVLTESLGFKALIIFLPIICKWTQEYSFMKNIYRWRPWQSRVVFFVRHTCLFMALPRLNESSFSLVCVFWLMCMYREGALMWAVWVRRPLTEEGYHLRWELSLKPETASKTGESWPHSFLSIHILFSNFLTKICILFFFFAFLDVC